MSELISGREALIALANGEEVEVRSQFVWKWVNLKDVPEYRLTDILENKHCDQFRLKNRTIELNGIEIPTPFDPKEGDYVYFICSDEISGYAETTLRDTPRNWGFVQFGAWRTEDEIKQVVAALRKVFKGD